MLVLTRKVGEQILIGNDVVITVVECRPARVKIGVEAPKGVRITRIASEYEKKGGDTQHDQLQFWN